MNNTTDIVSFLSILAGIITASAAIITGTLKIIQMLPKLLGIIKNSFAYKALLNGIKYLLFFLSLALPNGMLVWLMMFEVAKNIKRILEPVVFFAVIIQITLFVSVYSFLWGTWLVPIFRRLFETQENKLEITKG